MKSPLILLTSPLARFLDRLFGGDRSEMNEVKRRAADRVDEVFDVVEARVAYRAVGLHRQWNGYTDGCLDVESSEGPALSDDSAPEYPDPAEVSWNELRKLASSLGVSSHQKERPKLERDVRRRIVKRQQEAVEV